MARVFSQCECDHRTIPNTEEIYRETAKFEVALINAQALQLRQWNQERRTSPATTSRVPTFLESATLNISPAIPASSLVVRWSQSHAVAEIQQQFPPLALLAFLTHNITVCIEDDLDSLSSTKSARLAPAATSLPSKLD